MILACDVTPCVRLVSFVEKTEKYGPGPSKISGNNAKIKCLSASSGLLHLLPLKK